MGRVKKPSGRGVRRHRTERTERYLVVTEGAVTEPMYFDRLKKILAENLGIQLVVEPNVKAKNLHWDPSPVAVVKRCIQKRDEDSARSSSSKHPDLMPFKAAIAVVDVDHRDNAGAKGKTELQRAIELANESGIKLVVSNSKFEVWLLWHIIESVPNSARGIEEQCKKHRVLQGKRLSVDFPIRDFPVAALRADKKQRVAWNEKGVNPSTSMPRVFELFTKEKL